MLSRRIMRVVLNLEQLCSPIPGGIARVAAELARLLPERFPNDEYLGVVARHSPQEVAEMRARFGLPDLPIEVLPLPRPLLFEGWHWLGCPGWGSLVKRTGPVDVIHSPHAAVPPRARGAALVVTIHDAATELFPESYPRHGRMFHRRGFRVAARRADRVITVSAAAKAELVRYTPIPEQKIDVVANAVGALHVSSGSREATRTRYGFGDDPVIAWVGTMEPRKNLTTLVDAFRDVLTVVPRARLVLIGPDGWSGAAEAVRSRALPLGDRVVLAGRCSDEDRNALIAAADLFAFPSVHEGFGLPVLEAMQLGTAVIASDIPALREVTQGAAELCDPTDVAAWAGRLEALLSDPQRRAALADRGKGVAGARSWENVADETHAVYERAIAHAAKIAGKARP